MKYKLKVYSIWEFGQRKDAAGNPHQEDCTFPLPGDLKDSDRTFILCDGMGGHDAGEVASATVCESMGRHILNDGHDAEGVFTDDDLKNAIAAAFGELDRKDSGAEKKMGTTMTFLKLHNDGATVAHMGDSRVYHIRPGKDGAETRILFATEDHSLVNDLVKAGEITREEARTSRQKNVITRAMQPNMDSRPKADIRHITDIRPDDYFYMCSDGMLEAPDMESGESLRNIFSGKVPSPEAKVKILKEVTKDNRDNHTALIIHIEEVIGAVPAQPGKSAAADPDRMGIVEDDGAQAAPVGAGNNNTAVGKGHSKNTRRLIIRAVMAAVVVAVAVWAVNHFSSGSEPPAADNVDTPAVDAPDKIRRSAGKPSQSHGVGEQRQSAAPQPDGQPKDETLESEGHNASQTVVPGDAQPSQEAANEAANSADVSTSANATDGKVKPAIKLPSSDDGVVDSDEQIIRNTNVPSQR